MRKLTIAALAGLTIAGATGIAGVSNAQPYRYWSPYDHRYHYRYDDDDDNAGAALAGSVLGALLGADRGYYESAPVDRYGPDPDGMLAPDGYRVECRLRTHFDYGRDAYVTRRVCWEDR